MSTSCPGLLAWHPALSFTTTQCQWIGFTAFRRVDPSLISNRSQCLSQGPAVRAGTHHGLEIDETWPKFNSPVTRFIAHSTQDTLVKVGKIEKGVRASPMKSLGRRHLRRSSGLQSTMGLLTSGSGKWPSAERGPLAASLCNSSQQVESGPQ